MKRAFLVIAVVAACLSQCAWSNPLILIPTGTTLTTGQFRLEGAFSPNNDNGKYFWFATGFLQLEGSVIRVDHPTGPDENRYNTQWCVLPETFITPAVAFGVTDIASQSKEGIGGFLVATKHISTEGVVPVLNEFSATLGVGVKGIRGMFGGFEMKFPYGIFAQGEYDSRDLNGAVGWQPIPMLRLKAYTIRTELYYGAELLPITF